MLRRKGRAGSEGARHLRPLGGLVAVAAVAWLLTPADSAAAAASATATSTKIARSAHGGSGAGTTVDRSTGSRRPQPVVAIIDTGIADIPALGESVEWSSTRSFVPGESPTDRNGHGTEAALIVHRAAPNARLLAIKALSDDGAGSDPWAARAVRYAVRRGARVVNLSFASSAPMPRLRAAIAAAKKRGVLVVVAAGNEALDTDAFPTYPAGYRLANELVIAATDGAGRLAANSNWGHRSVNMGALGVAVPTQDQLGNDTAMSGSSAAAAVTTGTAAAILAVRPRLSLDHLRRLLIRSGDRVRPLRRATSSGRQLNPVRAIQAWRRLK